MRRQAVALDLKQQFRRGADHLERGRPNVEQVRTGVDPPERAVDADAVERPPRGGVRGQIERLPSGEHDLDGLAGRDGVLGDLHGTHVGVSPETRLDRTLGGRRCLPTRTTTRIPTAARDLGGGRPGGPFERLEDRGLGDPVASFEVRRLRVQRRDGGQRVGQVVEDQDEVRLDERRGRDADRIVLRQRDAGLERGDGVVRKRADGTAGEPGHPLNGEHASTRDEPPDGIERVRSVVDDDRQVRGVDRDRDGAGLDAGAAVADLQQPAWADPDERVAAEPLSPFDRLEQVGGSAIIEAEERSDRRFEVCRARRAQQDRVGVGSQTLGLGQAERIHRRHRGSGL